MRLKSCTFHNMGPFADFTVDLEALGEDQKLVALVGRNGAGKSFTLEAAIAGASYRKMPTNGTLVKRATARDSWMEAKLHYGQGWTIRHVVDAVSGKSEAVVLSESGAPVLADTKVSSFDAWAAKHLPDEDVLFSSVFAAQQSEGFVKMGSAERIDVILSVIGVSRLERMAKSARARRDSAESALKAMVTRIAEARGDTPAVEAAELALAAAVEAAETVERLLRKARQGVESAEVEDRRVDDLVKAYDAAVAKQAELSGLLTAEQARAADLQSRVTNNRAVQNSRAEILVARTELEALTKADGALALELAEVSKPFDAEAQALAAELAAQRLVVTAAEAEVKAAEVKLGAAKAAERENGDRMARAAARCLDEERVKQAALDAVAIRERLDLAQAEIAGIERDLAEQRATTLAGAEGRILDLRVGLSDVAQLPAVRADEAGQLATATLRVDDAAAELAVSVPARIATLEALSQAKRDARFEIEQELSRAERLAARADEMTAARLELTNAKAAAVEGTKDRDLLTERLELASSVMLAARLKAGEIGDRAQTAETRRAALEAPARLRIVAQQKANTAHRAELEPLAAKYDRLIAADARLAELDPQLAASRAEAARLEALVSATPVPAAPSAAPDVAAYKQAASRLEVEAREAHGAAAVARQRLDSAHALNGRVAGLEAERVTLEADLADWTRLALDLGRSGLQSAEVDSAGPELTELVNDLLRSCHGPRFTVSVDTQRLDSTGHKMLDECRIQVIDTVMGTEKEIREHSGGERALLGTAVSLALTMLACRRAGFDRPTIVRDESGANLDVDNAPAWIAMLRRAVEVTGADRLVFVDHRPEIVAMADAVIEIRVGLARLRERES